MIRIPLTDEQRTALLRPVGKHTQRGGFQRLIERVQEGIRGNVLTLTFEEGRSVLRYSAPSYGNGTYQSQLRAIAPQVEAALKDAGALEVPAPALF